MFRSLCRNSLMVFIGAFDSRRVCFSAEHGPLCEKAFSSANVALVLHSPPPAGESGSSRRESCLLPLYSPTARCIQMRPDYAKYLFTHLRAEKTGIEIFGMKGLYLCLPLW